MNYERRDAYGMHKIDPSGGTGPARKHGPGPDLMGAHTLTGNDVYNHRSEDLGDIKEIGAREATRRPMQSEQAGQPAEAI